VLSFVTLTDTTLKPFVMTLCRPIEALQRTSHKLRRSLFAALIEADYVAMALDHNRDIAMAARSVLRPIGCVQKGRSRTWLDDRGWWVGVIEFQPSGWSKGSYLNVGACFLWSKTRASFSFDDLIGDRPWYDAVDGESFVNSATKLARPLWKYPRGSFRDDSRHTKINAPPRDSYS
jgi:hypothetical protein